MCEQVARIGVGSVSRGVDHRHVRGSCSSCWRKTSRLRAVFYLNSPPSEHFRRSNRTGQLVSGLPLTSHQVSKITSIPQLTHHSPITIKLIDKSRSLPPSISMTPIIP